jgi:hypothetical protein
MTQIIAPTEASILTIVDHICNKTFAAAATTYSELAATAAKTAMMSEIPSLMQEYMNQQVALSTEYYNLHLGHIKLQELVARKTALHHAALSVVYQLKQEVERLNHELRRYEQHDTHRTIDVAT